MRENIPPTRADLRALYDARGAKRLDVDLYDFIGWLLSDRPKPQHAEEIIEEHRAAERAARGGRKKTAA